MASIRQQVLNNRKSVISGIPGLAALIVGPLFVPASEDDLPAISIFMGDDETTDSGTIGALTMSGTLSVKIFTNGSDPQAAADDLEVKIHEALMNDRSCGGLAKLFARIGTEFSPSDDGFCWETNLKFAVDFATQPNHLDQQA